MPKTLYLDYFQRRTWEYEGNFYSFLPEKREKSDYRGDSVTLVLRDVDKPINDSSHLGYFGDYNVYNRNERTMEKLRDHLRGISEDLIAFSCDRPPFDWIPFNAFKNVKFDARGGFATLFTARLKHPFESHYDTVVLKNIGKRITGENLNELKIFASNTLSVNSIVYFYGITQDPTTEEYAFVLELDYKVNLHDYHQFLHRRVHEDPEELFLEWTHRAQNVAWCLFHFHEQDLLHGDFHSRHILVSDFDTEYSNICLCDLASTGPETEQHRDFVRGVIPYMAPETISHGIFTKASEVYNLGVILWEISAGRPPFAGKDFRTLRRQIVQDHQRETPLLDTPDWYIELYEWCWHPDPAYRPIAAMVLKILDVYTPTPSSFVNDSRIRDHPAISKWLSLPERERRARLRHIPWPGRLHSPPLVYDKDIFRSKIIKTLDAEDAEDTKNFKDTEDAEASQGRYQSAWEVLYPENLETCKPSQSINLSRPRKACIFAWGYKGNFYGTYWVSDSYPSWKGDFRDYVMLVPKASIDANKPVYGPNLRSISDSEGNVYEVHDRNEATLEILRRHLEEEYIEELAIFPWRRYLDWIPFDAFSEIKYLARGGFAEVFTARLEMWNIVFEYEEEENVKAAKTVALKKIGKRIAEENLNELKIFAREVLHDAVKFYGITQDPTTEEYVLVLEFKSDGSIRDFHQRLHKNSEDRNKYWLGLAKEAADALHSFHNTGLLHGDLHSGNILLEVDRTVLSDLAFAGPETEQRINEIRGVVPYMAPEYLAHGIFTKASEIYSLGVILWEISAGRPPFAGEDFRTLATQIVHNRRRETPLPDTPDWYVELYKWCWYPDPAYRPTAKEVCNIISTGYMSRNARIGDHPAIWKWLSLTEREKDKLFWKIPWPGHLHPPRPYDRNQFTSKIFKTLDVETAEAAQARSLPSKLHLSTSLDFHKRAIDSFLAVYNLQGFYSEMCELSQTGNLEEEK